MKLIRRLLTWLKKACNFYKPRVQYLELKTKEQKNQELKEFLDYFLTRELEMAKKEQVNVEPNGNVIEVVPEMPKDKAYSIVFDEQTQKWCAVELLFHYAAGTFGGVRVVEQNVNRQIIAERFHVLIGQNLL